MQLIKNIIHHFFTRKITIARWELNVFGIVIFSLGALFGLYVLGNEFILPKLFAATSPWTQTDWSGGVGSSTANQYSSASNIDTTGTAGQFSLTLTSGWSNDYANWQYRRKITFNNTTANLGVTSESLTNFPVLVKLDKDTDIDYSKTQDSGQDIRFTDSDGTILPYEIEKWDETASSYVWVKVPQIDINSSTDYMYLYYGNTGATDGQSASSVWDNSFLGVWHMNESSGTNIVDSKGINNGTKSSSTQPNPTTSGILAGAQTYTQGSSRIGTNIATALTNFTVEIWFKDDSVATGYERLADKSYTGCFWFGRNGSTASSWGGGVLEASDPYGVFVTLTDGQWHQIASIRSGTTHYVYGDGGSVQNSNTVSATACNSTNFGIGGYGDGSTSSQWFGGTIDEVRISNSARSKAWIAASYKSGTDAFNTYGSESSKYPTSGTLTSNIFDVGFAADWGNLTYTASASGVTVKVRTSDSETMYLATDWTSCTAKTSGVDLTGGCVTDAQRYVQYQVTLVPSGANTPTFSDISIAFSPSDQIQPNVNASAIAMSSSSSGGKSVTAGSWNNGVTPYFSWEEGSDNATNTSGVKGYCLYLGTASDADPGNSITHSGTSGLLINSPVIATGTDCSFIVSGKNIDLSSASYLSSSLTSGTTYYLKIKIIDNAGNTFDGDAASFSFIHDSTPPTNVAYISSPGSTYSNVADMFFTWPTSGGSAASDGNSDVLGYQYRIGADGSWKGTSTSSTCGLDYISKTSSTYTLTDAANKGSIDIGSNVVYFRTIDNACNPSSSSTYRTGNLLYGGEAPYFGGGDIITVTPNKSDENSVALSWSKATAASPNTVAHYYYMTKEPPTSLSTLQGNSSTYIDNGTSLTVSTTALQGVNKGGNTIYVVAVDDADPPNYSPSNYISGTFELNSSDPDNVGSLVASDSSIKSSSQWNVTLTWIAPTYKGAGNLTYLIKRSTDNVTFTQVGTTSGLSYVDNTPASAEYYYKVLTKDGANAQSSGTNAVSITPTGKWTTAPTLDSGPTADSLTTKKATITWTTSRSADSKIQYGTTSGSYGSVEPSNSTQSASHSIQLTGLNPGTTYYYKAKWTDEDGNTGTSSEKTFSTVSAPTTKNVSVTNIGLASGLINFTTINAASVKIYYGTTSSFGGSSAVSTSTSETAYTTLLSGLTDGTKYYYKINTFDSDGSEYEGTILDFTTLPRPKITDVRIQQVANTAQSTVLVTWTTNTEVSSIITYYPQGQVGDARDEVNVALIKGDHRMVIHGLLPQTDYVLIVKGRDKAGNEATSDSQRLTTATDTRPPQISGLHIEGSNPLSSSANQESTAQLIVSWNTDEPGTSQVEFGEGAGTVYTQKTQEDSNLTSNHMVIISGLTPSKVYHLRSISKDKAGNTGTSIDNVTIAPKATDSAFNLVINNLQQAFGFLGGLNR
jgi:hypothetical protein